MPLNPVSLHSSDTEVASFSQRVFYTLCLSCHKQWRVSCLFCMLFVLMMIIVNFSVVVSNIRNLCWKKIKIYSSVQLIVHKLNQILIILGTKKKILLLDILYYIFHYIDIHAECWLWSLSPLVGYTNTTTFVLLCWFLLLVVLMFVWLTDGRITTGQYLRMLWSEEALFMKWWIKNRESWRNSEKNYSKRGKNTTRKRKR